MRAHGASAGQATRFGGAHAFEPARSGVLLCMERRALGMYSVACRAGLLRGCLLAASRFWRRQIMVWTGPGSLLHDSVVSAAMTGQLLGLFNPLG